MGDGADVVHEVVGGDGLAVEEDSVDAVADQQLAGGGRDGRPVHQQEHRGQGHREARHAWGYHGDNVSTLLGVLCLSYLCRTASGWASI